MYSLFDTFDLISRPSVYVISDSQLAAYKQSQTHAEIAELNKLINGHNQAIERLTETRDLLQADLQKLEPSSTTTTTTTKNNVKD